MKPRNREVSRRPINSQEGVPNWILMAGGLLLSSLSIRLGYKLKQAVDSKQTENNSQILRDGKSDDFQKGGSCHANLNDISFADKVDNCCSCCNGSRNVEEVKQQYNGEMLTEPEMALVTVPTPESNKDNGAMWPSSPDHLETHHKVFHHSNSSDSPCVSESGSDVFSKREVIQKMRHQLKRRDDTILEMQDQIVGLQNSLNSQLSHNSHLQALLDAANSDLFVSEREVQRLRKVIADHCAGLVDTDENSMAASGWPAKRTNGHTHTNGYHEVESSLESLDNGRGDAGKVEILRREINELKELIEGKDYLLQSYKEQKSELSTKIKELQEKLDSQLPNIL